MVAWTAYEVCFVHLFAKGGPNSGVTYTPDGELFRSFADFLPTMFWTLALPVFRDFHFYFAHRLIHVRALYRCAPVSSVLRSVF